jgi:hypothetical protein
MRRKTNDEFVLTSFPHLRISPKFPSLELTSFHRDFHTIEATRTDAHHCHVLFRITRFQVLEALTEFYQYVRCLPI